MKNEYEKAIQKMKNLNENISEKEWNKIAKEEGLLSSESMKYISKKDFITLQKEVRAGQTGSLEDGKYQEKKLTLF